MVYLLFFFFAQSKYEPKRTVSKQLKKDMIISFATGVSLLMLTAANMNCSHFPLR